MRKSKYSRLKFNAILPVFDIVAFPYKKACGVYFLIRGDECIYVGKSLNVFARIGTHSLNKRFDKVFYLTCQKSDLDELECLFIEALRPIENRSDGNTLLAVESSKNKSAEAQEIKNKLSGLKQTKFDKPSASENTPALFGGSRLIDLPTAARFLNIEIDDLRKHVYDEDDNPDGDLPYVALGKNKRLDVSDFAKYFGITYGAI